MLVKVYFSKNLMPTFLNTQYNEQKNIILVIIVCNSLYWWF